MKKLFVLFILMLSGCTVTYETPKCELIQRGEPCLTNHACCNTTYNNYNHNPYWNWLYWNKPIQTNYIIVKPNKPNNRPNKPNNRPNNKPNKKKR